MPTFRDYHFHLPHYHVDHDRDLKLLFGSHLIFNILSMMVFFFFPLFLFQFSQSIRLEWFAHYSPLQQGLIVIAFYYAMMRVVALLTAVPLARMLSRHGVRFSLLLAHGLFIVKLAFLTQVSREPLLILPIAVCEGIFVNSYWIAYQLLLSKKAHFSRIGEDLGLLRFFLEFNKMLTPALGGIIIVTFGYTVLFMVGILLLLLSLGLVITLKTTRVPSIISLAEVGQLIGEPLFSRYILTFGGKYINDAVITLWPLYVFLFLGAVDKVGYLYSASLLLALLLSLVVGMYLDRTKTKWGFYFSGGTLGVVWLSRIFAVTPLTFALTDTIDKLISSVTWLFYDTLLFKAAKGDHALLYFTAREVVISLWAICLWTGIGLIFIFTTSAWQALFTLAAVGVLLSLLMTDTFTYGKKK